MPPEQGGWKYTEKKALLNRRKTMRRRTPTLAAATLAAATLVLAGCNVSDETKEYASQAVCASADTTIKSLEGTGAGARAAASLILDNAKDEHIREVAQKVIDGDTDEDLRKELSDWVKKSCS